MQSLGQIACKDSVSTLTSPAASETTQSDDTSISTPRIGELPTLKARFPNKGTFPDYLEVKIVSASAEPAGIQLPAYLTAEVVANHPTNLYWLVGRYEEDGSRKLVEITPVNASSEIEEAIEHTPSNYQLMRAWYTEGLYISDATDGEFVITRDIGPGDATQTVNGMFIRRGLAEPIEAILTFDEDNGLSSKLLSAESGDELEPMPGDQFELIDLYWGEDGQIISQPGKQLGFDKFGKLSLSRRVLDSGHYFAGVKADSLSGFSEANLANFLVSNDTLRTERRSYFDPVGGFQFLYPMSWIETDFGPNLTVIRDKAGLTEIRITRHPRDVGKTIEYLRDEALKIFGSVSILYEDRINLGSEGALRTVYTYQSTDGYHTGIFFTFARGGTGYVLDIDAVSQDDQQILGLTGDIIDSWVERPIGLNSDPGPWQRLDYQNVRLIIPSDYRRLSLDNGWERLDSSSHQGFIAFRSMEATDSVNDQLLNWLDIASKEVSEFNYSERYEMQVNVVPWLRYDFSYVDPESNLKYGSLMSTAFENDGLVFWTEALSSEFSDFEQQILSIILASVQEK